MLATASERETMALTNDLSKALRIAERMVAEDRDPEPVRRRIEAKAAELGIPSDHVCNVKIRLLGDGIRERQMAFDAQDYKNLRLLPDWVQTLSGPELLIPIGIESDPEILLDGLDRVYELAADISERRGINFVPVCFNRLLKGGKVLETKSKAFNA